MDKQSLNRLKRWPRNGSKNKLCEYSEYCFFLVLILEVKNMRAKIFGLTNPHVFPCWPRIGHILENIYRLTSKQLDPFVRNSHHALSIHIQNLNKCLRMLPMLLEST